MADGKHGSEGSEDVPAGPIGVLMALWRYDLPTMDVGAERAILTVYRRDGCTICDEAEALLIEELDLRREAGQPVPDIEHVDIERSADLEERYRARIPVFAIGRHEIDLVVTPGRLRSLLDRAAADERTGATSWT